MATAAVACFIVRMTRTLLSLSINIENKSYPSTRKLKETKCRYAFSALFQNPCKSYLSFGSCKIEIALQPVNQNFKLFSKLTALFFDNTRKYFTVNMTSHVNGSKLKFHLKSFPYEEFPLVR